MNKLYYNAPICLANVNGECFGLEVEFLLLRVQDTCSLIGH